MFQGGIVRAHGGQGAEAGKVVRLPQINAVLRGTTQTIRIWQGHGDAEEFSVDEVEVLCRRGDQALLDPSLTGHARADLMIDAPNGALQCLIVSRQWLVAFLASARRALKVHATAQAMAPKRPLTCIDTESEPGSWARHLRHTAPMRSHAAGGDGADSS